MTLIKIYNDNKTKYFSTKRNVAEYIGICFQNINYYMNKGKEVNGWRIEYSNDNVMSNEIDKFNE